jgi:hypothetical protein
MWCFNEESKLLVSSFVLLLPALSIRAQAPNSLTFKRESRRMELLFDGTTTGGWRSARGELRDHVLRGSESDAIEEWSRLAFRL